MEKPNTSFMGLPFVKSFVIIVVSLHFRFLPGFCRISLRPNMAKDIL